MSETTPLIKAALNLRVGVGFDVYDGHKYSLEKKPHPIKPLRKAYFKFFPELAQYLYENDCIPDTNMNSLFHFLRTFVHLML